MGLGADASILQDRTANNAGLTRPPQALERSLRLGLEADLFRHTRLAPTLAIFSPVLRQIRPRSSKRTRKSQSQRAAVDYLSSQQTMATSALHWPSDPSPRNPVGRRRGERDRAGDEAARGSAGRSRCRAPASDRATPRDAGYALRKGARRGPDLQPLAARAAAR